MVIACVNGRHGWKSARCSVREMTSGTWRSALLGLPLVLGSCQDGPTENAVDWDRINYVALACDPGGQGKAASAGCRTGNMNLNGMTGGTHSHAGGQHSH